MCGKDIGPVSCSTAAVNPSPLPYRPEVPGASATEAVQLHKVVPGLQERHAPAHAVPVNGYGPRLAIGYAARAYGPYVVGREGPYGGQVAPGGCVSAHHACEIYI